MILTNYGCTFTTDRNEEENNAILLSNGNYLSSPHDDKLNTDYLSVSVWLYLNSYNRGAILDKLTSDTYLGFTFIQNFDNNQKLAFYSQSSGWVQSLTILPLETWIHVAIVINKNESKFYLNSVEDGTFNCTSLIETNQDINIGRDYYNSYLDGKLDQLRIYNWSLDQNEILEIYNLEKPIIEPKLYLHYKFDNGSLLNELSGPDLTQNGTILLKNGVKIEDENGAVQALNTGSFLQANISSIKSKFENKASLNLWVKLNSNDNSGNGGWTLHSCIQNTHYPWTNGLAYISTFRNVRVQDIVLDPSIDKTNWHMLTITTEPGINNWKFYQNGILVKQEDGLSTVYMNDIFYLLTNNQGFNLNGSIDNVRLYNYALSIEEINNLFVFENAHLDDNFDEFLDLSTNNEELFHDEVYGECLDLSIN